MGKRTIKVIDQLFALKQQSVIPFLGLLNVTVGLD
jgi:hypothetical protein